jgi:acetylornithine deacetylase/succinyl-diaminopimelate desuccinylase-like protein
MILANLSMVSQIPAPTFEEQARAELIMNRFAECGDIEPHTDDTHNVMGFLDGPGTTSRTILVFTHMDNAFERAVDQNITLTEHKAYGAGVADDNIALAVLLTLPDILRLTRISLQSRLVLLATSRFHGRGDFGGMRQFINDIRGRQTIDTAIKLTGIDLGRINYLSQSRIRGDITIKVGGALDEPPGLAGENNAILVANHVMDTLFSIPLPRKPKATLNIGMITGGTRYSLPGRTAVINFEALSEDDMLMNTLIEQIQDCCNDTGAKYGALVDVNFFGRLKTSVLGSSHPLVKTAIDIIKHLGFNPRMSYAMSEIAVCLSEQIPSVSIGLTHGEGGSSPESFIEIDPIATGILQLLMLLYEVDRQIQQPTDESSGETI